MLVPRFLFLRMSFESRRNKKQKNDFILDWDGHLFFFIHKISRTTFEFFQNPLFDNIAPL